ncbi:MAG: GNAT family N-acetyltransferase [Candidatus Limnocylindrales bacterium]
MATEGFEIRPLQAADVGAAIELARAQGFRDRTRFYEFVMRVPTCQPLVGIADGRLVATGLATASGRVGWLGGIAVEAGFRRRGFGRAVTEELIRLLELAGCETLSLEATEAGRPMYERMGFRLVSHYHQLQAGHLAEEPVPPPGTSARPLQETDLAAICALDRQATGEDRSAPLAILAESGGWVLEDEAAVLHRPGEGPGRLRGFLLPAERAYGAIVAPRFRDGLYLLDLHRHVVPEGAHVRAGVPGEHSAAVRELERRGWQETWRAPRMLLGPDVPGRRDWIWGQINSAMG